MSVAIGRVAAFDGVCGRLHTGVCDVACWVILFAFECRGLIHSRVGA